MDVSAENIREGKILAGCLYDFEVLKFSYGDLVFEESVGKLSFS